MPLACPCYLVLVILALNDDRLTAPRGPTECGGRGAKPLNDFLKQNIFISTLKYFQKKQATAGGFSLS